MVEATGFVPATQCRITNSAKNEEWLLALRVFIKDTLGTSWQIIKNKGKVRLGIRFKDGTRTYKWQRAKGLGLVPSTSKVLLINLLS